MTTKHQYLDIYPISTDSKKLIVGTIHPHDHPKFKLPFFYGNKLSIWTILSEAFPNDFDNPLSLNGILHFLKKYSISISDTIRECERKNPTALDSDLIPKSLNHEIVDQIRNSQISEIYFTSGFQKNNAFKLFFVDILKQRITKHIRDQRGLMLDNSFFGRPIKLNVLYSPAGTANVGLSVSKIYLANRNKYINSKTPVQDFKVDYYRQLFS